MQNLLKGDGSPTPDPAKNDLNLVGQRMGRSHQRLALDKDPGQVTQEIQNRILTNLDALIDQARTQEAESKSQQSQQKPQQAKPGQPQPGVVPHNNNPNGQQARNAGHTPAAVSVSGHDVNTDGTPTTDITQSMKEWGDLSPRQRAAIIEANWKSRCRNSRSSSTSITRHWGISSPNDVFESHRVGRGVCLDVAGGCSVCHGGFG